MKEALQIIDEYVRRVSPRAAGSTDLESMPVDRVFDSIGMMDFITFLERAFQVRISDADVLPRNFATFGAVAKLMASKRQPGA